MVSFSMPVIGSYYGDLTVKEVYAVPMMCGHYNAYKDWIIPEDENPLDEGYSEIE